MAHLGSHTKKVKELLAEFSRIKEIEVKKLLVSTELVEKRKLGPNDTHRTSISKWRHYCWSMYGVIGLAHALM